MTWLHNPVLLGRLAILPLAVVQWGIVMACLSYVHAFRPRSWQRVTTCVISAFFFWCTVAAQIYGYQWITSRRHANDDVVVTTVIVFESLLSLVLIFYVSKHRTRFFPGVRHNDTGTAN
jgi:hypothetical protein